MCVWGGATFHVRNGEFLEVGFVTRAVADGASEGLLGGHMLVVLFETVLFLSPNPTVTNLSSIFFESRHFS